MQKTKRLSIVLFIVLTVLPLIADLAAFVFYRQGLELILLISCFWYLVLAAGMFINYRAAVDSTVEARTLVKAVMKKAGNSIEAQKAEEEDLKLLASEAKKVLEKRLEILSSSMAELLNLTENLDLSLKDISGVSESIAAASESIAAGAASQASDVEGFSSFLADLVQKMEDISQMSESLIEEGNKTKAASEEGIGSLEELLSSNEEFGRVMEDIITKISTLTEQADNIARVTSVMSSIASQTSLLSLNASIEAARAGEAGKGFAVVADEIRKLSDQSQNASKDIGSMISTVFKDLLQVKTAIDGSKEVFERQKGTVKASEKAFKNIDIFISASIEQQHSFGRQFNGLYKLKDRLNESIESIASVTEQSAATTEELASLTMSQTNATVSLVDIVESLKKSTMELVAAENLELSKIMNTRKKKAAMMFCVKHPFFEPAIEAALKTARKYNVDIEIFSPRTQDIKEQLKMLEDIENKGFDALAISPNNDGPEVTKAINRLVEKGVKVICFDADASKSKRLAMFETSGINGGKVAARVAAKLLNNKGKVITNVWSDIKKTIIQDRAKGFEDEINSIVGMSAVTIGLPADPSEQEAEAHIKKVLDDYPDAALIYTTNLMWGLRFAKYFKKHKVDRKLITFDCDKEMGKFIEAGLVQSAIAQRQFVWGEVAVKWMVDAINGKEIPEYEDTGTFEVNKSTLSIFEKRLT